VGLVEVMVALAILLFGSLVIAHMQIGTLAGLQVSAFHLAVDRLSNEMIETLRTHTLAAADGQFDHAADNEASTQSRIDRLTASWRERVASAMPQGQSEIDCDAELCEVRISWREVIDGRTHRQLYRARAPL